jgi:hypothetical protein
MLKQMFEMMKEIEEEKAAAKSKSLTVAKPLASLSGLTESLGSVLSFGFGSKKAAKDDTEA